MINAGNARGFKKGGKSIVLLLVENYHIEEAAAILNISLDEMVEILNV